METITLIQIYANQCDRWIHITRLIFGHVQQRHFRNGIKIYLRRKTILPKTK